MIAEFGQAAGAAMGQATLAGVARGLLGMGMLLLIAWLLSSNRRNFPIKIVAGGLALQLMLAFLVLQTEWGRWPFDLIGRGVTAILAGCDAAAKFVFGPLAGSDPAVAWPAIAGIKIISTIIVFSTLSAIGYHFGVLQRVVAVMAALLTRVLGVSGAESLSGAANVFLGQTEAPFIVRPYLAGMTRSELMAVMTGGFATIAAGVMAVYIDFLSVGLGGAKDPEHAIGVARHFLTASLMSAPAAFVMAKIMLPETEKAATAGQVKIEKLIDSRNALDAATIGASQGMTLAINVIAMLIAFTALVYVIDASLRSLGQALLPKLVAASTLAAWNLVDARGVSTLSLQYVLGLLFSPLAYLIGVDAADRRAFGSLLGMAMATNEFLAYSSLSEMIRNGQVSERTVRLATYSLCGFANFASMGIQVAGIGSLAPTRRNDLVELAPRAMLGGAMASWMTGCIAGMLS